MILPSSLFYYRGWLFNSVTIRGVLQSGYVSPNGVLEDVKWKQTVTIEVEKRVQVIRVPGGYSFVYGGSFPPTYIDNKYSPIGDSDFESDVDDMEGDDYDNLPNNEKDPTLITYYKYASGYTTVKWRFTLRNANFDWIGYINLSTRSVNGTYKGDTGEVCKCRDKNDHQCAVCGDSNQYWVPNYYKWGLPPTTAFKLPCDWGLSDYPGLCDYSEYGTFSGVKLEED